MPIRYRADLTRVAIDSIRLYTEDDSEYKVELILVQEGKDKEITDLCQSYASKFNDIVFIQSEKPRGYAGALNAGMKIAKGDYYCFINNDIVATPNWMNEMLEATKLEDAGLVVPTFWGTGGRQSVDWNERINKRFDIVNEPFSLMGVCFLIPKSVMEMIGEWDESFDHGGEDFDICLRMISYNQRLIIARKAFIYHYGGASTRELFKSDLAKGDLKAFDKHRIIQMDKLIKKHNLDEDDVFQRLQIRK